MTDPLWHQFRQHVFDENHMQAHEMLKQQPALLSLRNGIGETVLHHLAVENAIRGVQWLHGQGADLNTRNKFGIPALFEVAQLGYRELYRWMIGNGADPMAVDGEGKRIEAFLIEMNCENSLPLVREPPP